MLQSLLVTVLRYRANTDPSSVMRETETLMRIRSTTRNNFSVSEGHQLHTLHGYLFFECTSGGSGPVTRSRKRAPVGDDDVVPSPVPSIRRQERPRVTAISPPVPCEPNVHAVLASTTTCIPPLAHNVPPTVAVAPIS